MKTLLMATLVLATSVAHATGSSSTTSQTTSGAKPAETGSVVAPTSDVAKKELVVEGPISKIVARKKEIYVQGAEKKHEFYFRQNTQLLKDGQLVDFSTLTEGTKVRVTYVKVGKRTDPVKVEVIQ